MDNGKELVAKRLNLAQLADSWWSTRIHKLKINAKKRTTTGRPFKKEEKHKVAVSGRNMLKSRICRHESGIVFSVCFACCHKKCVQK